MMLRRLADSSVATVFSTQCCMTRPGIAFRGKVGSLETSPEYTFGDSDFESNFCWHAPVALRMRGSMQVV